MEACIFTLGVFEHSLISGDPVYSICQTFEKRVGEHHICIASTLGVAFAKIHPAVREPALETVDVNKTSHHKCLAERVNQSDEWMNAPIRIPDTIV